MRRRYRLEDAATRGLANRYRQLLREVEDVKDALAAHHIGTCDFCGTTFSESTHGCSGERASSVSHGATNTETSDRMSMARSISSTTTSSEARD